jgi:serine/threonine protein phosphatase PrpC
LRLNSPELSALQLQSLLVRTIREEFEYNHSQQLYVSDNSWELIKNAKEETIAMINNACSGLPEEAHSADLVKSVFEMAVSRGKLPVETALGEIKKELQKLF